ncbi:MAG: heparan-alpha-glucosaminide N-acetyltransferase domain-containing protein [Candidatus Heimdallarchaeaceae archaeon]
MTEQAHIKTGTELSDNISTKRFSSLDFLRGLAIILMIILHQISDLLDIDTLVGDLNNVPLINMVLLLLLPFIGGLAGLFLLTSAISNMISMQKNTLRGRSVLSIAIKQIIGGIVLLVFAMITEAITGYHGMFGQFLHNPTTRNFINWNIVATRWAYFETIHTIAWCVIITGIVQGLLSINEGWKKPRRQMAIYAILAVIVLVCTKFIWDGLWTGYGYPWLNFSDGSSMWQPDVRTAGFGAVLVGIFVNPLASPWEPIFPYLAVSFIGSIIGIALTQPKKALFKGFTKTVLLVGLVMFIGGAVGSVTELINVMSAIDGAGGDGFGEAINFYRLVGGHRFWTPDAPQTYAPYISNFAWLWQFLFTNGFSIMLVMITIYLVEFRGRGSHFAKKTRYVRRYGIIAFTNYNNQWLYWLPPAFIPLIFGLNSYDRMLWGGTLLMVLTSILFYTIILYAWGLVNYRFSFEWLMRSIGYLLLPIRRTKELKAKKWWQKGDIDVKGTIRNGDWINIVEENEAYHKAKTDSRISMILSIFSLAIPVFFAFSIITLPMSIRARKNEGSNKKNTTALVLSIIGVVITVAFLVVGFAFTPASLGLAL